MRIEALRRRSLLLRVSLGVLLLLATTQQLHAADDDPRREDLSRKAIELFKNTKNHCKAFQDLIRYAVTKTDSPTQLVEDLKYVLIGEALAKRATGKYYIGKTPGARGDSGFKAELKDGSPQVEHALAAIYVGRMYPPTSAELASLRTEVMGPLEAGGKLNAADILLWAMGGDIGQRLSRFNYNELPDVIGRTMCAADKLPPTPDSISKSVWSGVAATKLRDEIPTVIVLDLARRSAQMGGTKEVDITTLQNQLDLVQNARRLDRPSDVLAALGSHLATDTKAGTLNAAFVSTSLSWLSSAASTSPRSSFSIPAAPATATKLVSTTLASDVLREVWDATKTDPLVRHFVDDRIKPMIGVSTLDAPDKMLQRAIAPAPENVQRLVTQVFGTISDPSTTNPLAAVPSLTAELTSVTKKQMGQLKTLTAFYSNRGSEVEPRQLWEFAGQVTDVWQGLGQSHDAREGLNIGLNIIASAAASGNPLIGAAVSSAISGRIQVSDLTSTFLSGMTANGGMGLVSTAAMSWSGVGLAMGASALLAGSQGSGDPQVLAELQAIRESIVDLKNTMQARFDIVDKKLDSIMDVTIRSYEQLEKLNERVAQLGLTLDAVYNEVQEIKSNLAKVSLQLQHAETRLADKVRESTETLALYDYGSCIAQADISTKIDRSRFDECLGKLYACANTFSKANGVRAAARAPLSRQNLKDFSEQLKQPTEEILDILLPAAVNFGGSKVGAIGINPGVWASCAEGMVTFATNWWQCTVARGRADAWKALEADGDRIVHGIAEATMSGEGRPSVALLQRVWEAYKEESEAAWAQLHALEDGLRSKAPAEVLWNPQGVANPRLWETRNANLPSEQLRLQWCDKPPGAGLTMPPDLYRIMPRALLLADVLGIAPLEICISDVGLDENTEERPNYQQVVGASGWAQRKGKPAASLRARLGKYEIKWRIRMTQFVEYEYKRLGDGQWMGSGAPGPQDQLVANWEANEGLVNRVAMYQREKPADADAVVDDVAKMVEARHQNFVDQVTKAMEGEAPLAQALRATTAARSLLRHYVSLSMGASVSDELQMLLFGEDQVDDGESIALILKAELARTPAETAKPEEPAVARLVSRIAERTRRLQEALVAAVQRDPGVASGGYQPVANALSHVRAMGFTQKLAASPVPSPEANAMAECLPRSADRIPKTPPS